jgi:RNA ligase
MKYTFPAINHISDVLPAIAGADEFHINEKDGYTVISYHVQNPDTTFPVVRKIDELVGDEIRISGSENVSAALRRECRGLIFCNETGKVLSRGYHKFFNQNERLETQDIDLSQPHVILEKLDGSMLRPRWITKAGITEVSMQVEEWLAENPELQKKYEELALSCLKSGHIPIFEWCSRKQRIVLDYPEDALILTAMRCNITGKYTSFTDLVLCGERWDIPVVYPVGMYFLEQEGVEGIVIRFDDGHMVKVKTDWYVLRHKALDGLRSEKNVLKLILDEGVDDVMPLLDAKMQEYLGGYVDRVFQKWNEYAKHYTCTVNNYKHLERKEFANLAKTMMFPWLAFKVYDGKDALETIKDKVSHSLSSQTTVDNIRELIGPTWY